MGSRVGAGYLPLFRQVIDAVHNTLLEVEFQIICLLSSSSSNSFDLHSPHDVGNEAAFASHLHKMLLDCFFGDWLGERASYCGIILAEKQVFEDAQLNV